MTSEQELERDAKIQANDAFAYWLDSPTNRVLISTIPAGEHKEALHALLRSAFDCGFAGGQGNVTITLLKAMMKRCEP